MTSEDERDPAGSTVNGRPVYWIKRKVWRSEAMTTFIRRLDVLREQALIYSPRRRQSTERVRSQPPEGQETECTLKALPTHLPIECYGPDFYNNLPPAIRAECAYPEVVFP